MTQQACPRCSLPIPPDAPGGDCPRCLLSAGLHPDPAWAPEPDELALRFPRLEVLERIGRGGMGVVYRARQRSLDREVALKVLPPDAAAQPGFAERFEREARSLARLDHQNVVRVYEADVVDGLYYLIMEYVDGTDLRSAMRAGLQPPQALRVVGEICDALQYAHDRGIVHRDIKPENILLDRAGRVKIADFGLAKIVGTRDGAYSITGAAMAMGTPHYMAPEQMSDSAGVDHRADIYSLGVVFYEMLTGALPIGRFPPPSEKVAVDVRLDDVVLRALESERERRYQRVDDVKTRVSSIQSAPDPAPRPTPRVTDGARVTNTKAIFGLLAFPGSMVIGAMVMGLGMIGTGGENDVPSALGGITMGAIMISGIVLCFIARREIASDARQSGNGLAVLGILLPVFFGVGLAALGLYLRAGVRSNLARLEAEAAHRQAEMWSRAAIHAAMSALHGVVMGGSDRDELIELYAPSARERLRRLTAEEWSQLGAEGELNLPVMLADSSRATVWVARWELDEAGSRSSGDRAMMRVRDGRWVFDVPLTREAGVWRFSLEPIVTVTGARPR